MEAVVYYWFRDCQMDMLFDKSFPILLAVSSLRKHNLDIPIYVIDASRIDQDWKDYPDRFKFEVIKYNNHPDGIKTKRHSLRVKALSDCIYRLPERRFLFVESDIFWKADPFPLPYNNKFRHVESQGGVYMLDKVNDVLFLDLWNAFSTILSFNEEMRKVIGPSWRLEWEDYGLDRALDSMEKYHSDLVEYLDNLDYNFGFHNLILKNKHGVIKAKNIHCSQAVVGINHRYLLPVLLKDFSFYNLDKKEIHNTFDKYSFQDIINDNKILYMFINDIGWSISKSTFNSIISAGGVMDGDIYSIADIARDCAYLLQTDMGNIIDNKKDGKNSRLSNIKI